jgi:superfamily II DNA/RNA helicase
VSTDAAARGIDIAGVTHVVQADFATNAVEFLHRIGRTARAGRSGKVSSLYQPDNAALAQALRQFIEAGEPIEGAFSRNRSFSKKLKEYGKFVPRGQ